MKKNSESEDIKKILDDILDSMEAHRQAYDNADAAGKAYRDAEINLANHFLSMGMECSKTHEGIFVHDGIKIKISVRFNKKGDGSLAWQEVKLNHEKLDIQDLDRKPFEKEDSIKAKLIVQLYDAQLFKEAKDELREAARYKYLCSKTNAIQKLGIRKPIKYRDVIFQVYASGYYGERDLQMQDADMKKI